LNIVEDGMPDVRICKCNVYNEYILNCKEIRKYACEEDIEKPTYVAKRDRRGIRGRRVFDVSVKDRRIIHIPVKITPAGMTLEGIREKMARLGLPKVMLQRR